MLLRTDVQIMTITSASDVTTAYVGIFFETPSRLSDKFDWSTSARARVK